MPDCERRFEGRVAERIIAGCVLSPNVDQKSAPGRLSGPYNALEKSFIRQIAEVSGVEGIKSFNLFARCNPEVEQIVDHAADKSQFPGTNLNFRDLASVECHASNERQNPFVQKSSHMNWRYGEALGQSCDRGVILQKAVRVNDTLLCACGTPIQDRRGWVKVRMLAHTRRHQQIRVQKKSSQPRR